MKINQIIRQKRRALSLTQEQVAEYLGVTASAVNKWERGGAYPDIMLLPALARLLHTDLNTLMSFQEDLTDLEIANFVNRVDEVIRGGDYAAGYRMAMDKIHEFPTCDRLILQLVVYLDGALAFSQVEDPEALRKTFDPFYARLSASGESEIRETALCMRIARCRAQKDFDGAEALIAELPAVTVDREEQWAILQTQREKYPEAQRMWERRLLKRAMDIYTSLMCIMEIAVRESRLEDAAIQAQTHAQITRLLGLPPWTACAARLQLSVLTQDAPACLAVLEEMLSAMDAPWHPQDSPLYRHLAGKDSGFLSSLLSEALHRDLKDGDSFAFIRNSDAFPLLLKKIEAINEH